MQVTDSYARMDSRNRLNRMLMVRIERTATFLLCVSPYSGLIDNGDVLSHSLTFSLSLSRSLRLPFDPLPWRASNRVLNRTFSR